jgi:putative hydrolase of the HAD superfamily
MLFFDIDGTLLDHKRAEYLGVMSFYEEFRDEFKIGEDHFYQIWCTLTQKHFDRYLKSEVTFHQQHIDRIKELYGLLDIKITDDLSLKRFDIYLKNMRKIGWHMMMLSHA